MPDAKLPSTLDEAVDILLVGLSNADKARLAAMSDEDLPMLRFSFGMGIATILGSGARTLRS